MAQEAARREKVFMWQCAQCVMRCPVGDGVLAVTEATTRTGDSVDSYKGMTC